MRSRVALAVAGGLVGGYGLWLLVTRVPAASLLLVGVWMVVAIMIHDAVWSPTVLGLGVVVSRLPARGRTFVQAGLVVAGCLVVVAAPMIVAQGRQPESTTILVQPLGWSLVVLLGCVAGSTLLAWLFRLLRDRRPAAERDDDQRARRS